MQVDATRAHNEYVPIESNKLVKFVMALSEKGTTTFVFDGAQATTHLRPHATDVLLAFLRDKLGVAAAPYARDHHIRQSAAVCAQRRGGRAQRPGPHGNRRRRRASPPHRGSPDHAFTPMRRALGAHAVRTLEVRLGSTLVGTLTHLGNEAVIFTFDRAYLEDRARPTLSLG